MRTAPPDSTAFNSLVWEIVRQIPPGRVSTYGQIASMLPPPPGVDPLQYARLGAIWVGHAMHAVPDGSDVPWQRVINSQGQISLRAGSDGAERQRILLESEGITFDDRGQVDFATFGWEGPDQAWLAAHHLYDPKPLKGSGKPTQLDLF